ncbi:MAG: hypothetical protein ACKO2P_08075 [Planctomycetota bacterium]
MPTRAFLSMDLSDPTWWAYVGLVILAVYFRFSRFFSIRNLDLLLLIGLSTSLTATIDFPRFSREHAASPRTSRLTSSPLPTALPLLVSLIYTPADEPTVAAPQTPAPAPVGNSANGSDMHRWGAFCLVVFTLLLLLRLIVDESLTRRPKLDQNLNTAGLVFLCIPAFAILMAHVAFRPPPAETQKMLITGKALLERRNVPVASEAPETTSAAENLPISPTGALVGAGGHVVSGLAARRPEVSARILVILAHSLVLTGLLAVSRWHFASNQIGVAMCCLYLLLPCTAASVHQLGHVLPAACLIWAFASWRRPTVSGILLGLACGTLFFTAFLLPLWAVSYGRRASVRFLISVLAVAAVLITTLLLISSDASSFTGKLMLNVNWTVYRLLDSSAVVGEVSTGQTVIRIIMAAVFFMMLTAMTAIPRQRNLEGLLANSTSLIVAAQMWYPDDIGRYVLWYLPLLLLVIFRPRLDRLLLPPAAPASTG